MNRRRFIKLFSTGILLSTIPTVVMAIPQNKSATPKTPINTTEKRSLGFKMIFAPCDYQSFKRIS